MVVGGLGPEPQPALQTQGQKRIPWLCSSLICALRRGGGPGPWAREELQERWGGAEASSGWGEIWGEGYCHGLHAHIHVNSPEKYTHTHIQHTDTRTHTPWKPEGRTRQQSNYNATTGSNKVQALHLTMEIPHVNCKCLSGIITAHGHVCCGITIILLDKEKKEERRLWKESKSSIMRNSLGRA